MGEVLYLAFYFIINLFNLLANINTININVFLLQTWAHAKLKPYSNKTHIPKHPEHWNYLI